MDCIFCKIISGEIPCYKIYENEYVLAFLDIAKDFDGHTLVIPKKHFENILDIDNFYLIEVLKAVKLISKHYVDNCGYTGVNVLNASGQDAGQSVFHLHFHILPRNNDGQDAFPKLNYFNHSLEEMHNKLKIN